MNDPIDLSNDSSDSETDAEVEAVCGKGVLKRGRPSNDVWTNCREIELTTQVISGTSTALQLEAPQKRAQCTHCDFIFNFPMRRKVERVKEHMSKCSGIHSKKFKQTTIRTVPLIPSLANDDLDRFHELFAKWVYESGTPFSRIESKTLKDALSVLRPNITLPTRANMSNSLLNQTFETVAGSISEMLKKSGE
jgi:hypothetical protein